MLTSSVKGGFSGTSFVWEKYCFSRTGTASACATEARRQRPCASAAQRADESSSSRSRLAKSYGRFAPLSLKQDCFFRLPSSKIKISLPGPSAADNVTIFLQKLHLPDSAQIAFKSLRLLLRRLSLKSSLRSSSLWWLSPLSRRRDDFQKSRGSARSCQKSFQKI